jgi:hypothetical protein
MPEEEKEDRQDRMIEILEELLKWTKVTSIPQVDRSILPFSVFTTKYGLTLTPNLHPFSTFLLDGVCGEIFWFFLARAV